MKKLILLMFVVAGFLVSCEGPMGPEGPAGEPGYGTNWYLDSFVIGSNQWQEVTDGEDTYYKYIFDLRKLTEQEMIDIYNDGNLLVYMYRTDEATNTEIQVLLPYIVNWSNEYNETQAEVFYYNFTPYDVAIYFAASGDNSGARPADDYEFRIVAQW